MTLPPITWAPTDTLSLRIAVHDGPPRLAGLSVEGVPILAASATPLVEVGVVGQGRSWSARRYLDSTVGARMTYEEHAFRRTGAAESMDIVSRDPSTGLRLTTTLSVAPHCAAVRICSTVTNEGSHPLVLAWITSAVVGGVLHGRPLEEVELWWADNDWLAECRWHTTPVRSVLPDLTRSAHQHDARGNFSRTALGTWSTDGSLPMGAITHAPSGTTLGWQIEHNGPWHWQVGEHTAGLYVSALGPTDTEHAWNTHLAPGQRFTTVPATLAASNGGFTGMIAELTTSRRFHRRPHRDLVDLPVIFNDYMNTLMGDPTTTKLLPLIDAAAAAGAEIFCIDAGWYDDNDGWWDSVGAWEPAPDRFPGGISEVLDRIRSHGMTPGLWLEPEVVGVRSPIADSLPIDAFFQREGERIVEHGRYQLDLRHPLARKHLDLVVDRLVDELGVGYFKLDYNINPGAGTDLDAVSVGAGLLGHNRAYLDWIDSVLDRHPELTLENCASGGMRIDYALLSRLQIQSTSDQQDPYRYPVITASAATAITPEQAASWAYPQPSFTDDEIAFTMNGALLGRLQLSGHLDHMTPAQQALVTEAVSAYRSHRSMIATAQPFWPLGLPNWNAGWIAHGLCDDTTALITIWRRDDDAHHTDLTLPSKFGGPATPFIVYPTGTDAIYELLEESGVLRVTIPRKRQSVTLAVTIAQP